MRTQLRIVERLLLGFHYQTQLIARRAERIKVLLGASFLNNSTSRTFDSLLVILLNLLEQDENTSFNRLKLYFRLQSIFTLPVNFVP